MTHDFHFQNFGNIANKMIEGAVEEEKGEEPQGRQ